MQTASCLVVLNEFKSSVPKKDVTPAEVMLLIHLHHENAGEIPIKDLKISATEVNRTSAEEKNRLKSFYKPFSQDAKAVTVEKLWPGTSAQLPQTFEEVTDVEGNKVFSKGGTPVAKKIKVGDKEYTEEELIALTKPATPEPKK